MRTANVVAVVALTVLGISACKQEETAVNDLTQDLARASRSEELNLAPVATALRGTVSTLEQIPSGRPRVALATRTTTPRATPRPKPVAEVAAAQPAEEATAEEVAEPAPVPEAPSAPAPEPATTVATAPDPDVNPAPRPRPVAVPVSTGSGGGWGGGTVVIRGGTAGDDHCDPRTDRGGGFGVRISINNRIPTF